MSSDKTLRGPIGRPLVLSIIALTMCLNMVGDTFGHPVEAGQQKYLVYVGTYTDRDSKGIYAYSFDPKNGRLALLDRAADTADVSFLAFAPGGRFLYATSEIPGANHRSAGAVSAFAVQPKTVKLLFLNQVSSHDDNPTHITLDRSGKYALVSNYTPGSVAVFPMLDDGRLVEASAFAQHKGSSVNPTRQEGPHAHATVLSPDNRFAIVADLGLDQLLVYRFDAQKGRLGTDPRIVKTAPGAGPRHLVFHPNGKFLYVINELQSTVVVYSYDAPMGTFRELQTISTLPKEFAGNNTAAEIDIHPSGKFLYASNRGDDSIAVFRVDPKRGTLTMVEIDATHGKTPSNFAFDPTGSWLLVANQGSGEIIVFRVQPTTGHLSPTGEVLPVISPACIKFVPAP
jgi:6-phosphogluconolactonase